MKYLIFDAGPIIVDRKNYKDKFIVSSTLTPQYPERHAGLYFYFGGLSFGQKGYCFY